MLSPGSKVAWYICAYDCKDSRYKIFWIGSDNGNDRVSESIYDISRIPDRLMIIKLIIDNSSITVLLCYASQVGLDNIVKDALYDLLRSTVSKTSAAEILVIYDDFNGHLGKSASVYESIHGSHGCGLRNTEVERILVMRCALWYQSLFGVLYDRSNA